VMTAPLFRRGIFGNGLNSTLPPPPQPVGYDMSRRDAFARSHSNALDAPASHVTGCEYPRTRSREHIVG
jgi:hypothetical protein